MKKGAGPWRVFARARLSRAGNAGLVASIVVALAGIGLSALATYAGHLGSAATASPAKTASIEMAPFAGAAPTERDRAVLRVIEGAPPFRFAAPELSVASARPTLRPKIVIILDDMGIDPVLGAQALALPGPMSYSFLPYGPSSPALARRAREAGDDVLLHLPMEPLGEADPGPNALRRDMAGAEFLKALEWNLSQFDGYVGVNNHMGSALTGDLAAMKTIIALLRDRGLFFLDSVTTGASVARRAGDGLGVEVMARDVFLDPTPGDADEVRRQLALAERIARETGYVIAIGHPRPETLAVLGPWATTAKARGFDLAPLSALRETTSAPLPVAATVTSPVKSTVNSSGPVLAASRDLRQ